MNERGVAGEKFARCALFMTRDTDTTVTTEENRINQRRRLWAWLEPYLWKTGTEGKTRKFHSKIMLTQTTKVAYISVCPGSKWVANALRIVHRRPQSWVPPSAAYLVTDFWRSNVFLGNIIQLEDPTHDVPDVPRAMRRLRQVFYEYRTQGTFFTHQFSLELLQIGLGFAAHNNNTEAMMWVWEINSALSASFRSTDVKICKYWCENAARGGHVHLIHKFHTDGIVDCSGKSAIVITDTPLRRCVSQDTLIDCLLQGYRESTNTSLDDTYWIEALRVLRVEMKCDWGDAKCSQAVQEKYMRSYNWIKFVSHPAKVTDTFLYYLMEMGCSQIGLADKIMNVGNYHLLRWFLRTDTGGGSRINELSKRACYCNMPNATNEFINWCREPEAGPPPKKIYK